MNRAKVTLTDEERQQVSTANKCLHGADCDGCGPLYVAVGSIVAARVAAVLRDAALMANDHDYQLCVDEQTLLDLANEYDPSRGDDL